MREPRFYNLFATYRGPSPHWQFHGKARVKGVQRDGDGELTPPLPNWHVRAVSATQACYFVRRSVTSRDRADECGVWSWPKWEAGKGGAA